MDLTRRQFLATASAITILPCSPSWAITALRPMSPPSVSSSLSQRSVLNVGFAYGHEYPFINHVLNAEQFGPSTGWSTGPTWMQSIGPNGYPKVSIKPTEGKSFGGGLHIPASFQYGEVGSQQYYVLRWKGNGDVRLMLNAGSWTYQAGKSINATPVGSDRWRTTSGSDTYIVLSFTGPAQVFPLLVFGTDLNNTGAYLSNLQFYRLADEADLQAGKIFRAPYKQSIVDLCPSAIRFMNWVGGNNSKCARFESRTRPDYPAWGDTTSNWIASPPYGETTGTNQYLLAAAAGTPEISTQGEVVTCRIGSGMVRTGQKSVTAISNSNPGRVTAAGHGFATGDTIVHLIPNGMMPKLNFLPCKITVIDKDNYSIDVNTTSFGSFGGTAQASQFISLNVGGRGSYPVVFPIPQAPASIFGDAYLSTGDYKTFIFDKTVAAQTDGNGNYIYGVWMFNDIGANLGHDGGVPLEICTALVNEVNAMHPARPIHMWINIPHLGLCSMDPDYTVSSSWGIQAVKLVLNGANGLPGLNTSSQLFVEYSNETWNSGGPAFSQTYYLAYRGFLRWPSSGTSDYASMAALRSVINVEDIKSSSFNSSRLRFVLAGQGTQGASGVNAARIDGSSFFRNDPFNVWGPTVAPITHHDHFAFAGYFAAQDSFDIANLATYTNIWLGSLGNPTAQESMYAAYVRGIVDPALGGTETIDRYRLTVLPALVAKLKLYGKSAIMYEGGWDHDIQPIRSNWSVSAALPYASGVLDGKTSLITNIEPSYAAALKPGHFVVGYGIPPFTRIVSVTGTTAQLSMNTTTNLAVAQFVAFTPQQMFLLSTKRSQSFAAAMLSFFNQFGSGSGMPAEYVANGFRWGHTFPNAYGSGNTEWSDLDSTWQQESARNRAMN